MKKALSLILALTLLLALAVPVFAENSTGGSTTVTYEVGNAYNITIPDAVTITNGTANQSIGVAENSVIPANQTLKFTITGATNYGGEPAGFRMKNSADNNVYLSYTILNDKTPVVKDTPFLSATPTEAYAGKSVTLTYTTSTAQSAGTYSDTLTFAVSLVNTVG